MTDVVTCSKCRQPFEVVEIGGGMTSPEPEDMRCPHCGHVTTRLARGRLRTRPVADTTSSSPPAEEPAA